jgi:UDP-4-amino-4,6-dideoxy-N-acetyl-beta-L-altrosamine transaminase
VQQAMFIPYSCQSIDDADIVAVTEVLKSDFLTQGPAVAKFEAAFARRHEVDHAVAVSNATSGLHIACLALGVGPGSIVWTTPNSFVASANCALYCGATVDFVDIDPVTRNMSLLDLEKRLGVAHAAGRLPNVVIPVDFSGMPVDLREMRNLANKHGFKILQDASHATGASYLGRPVGSAYADATVFSFHPVKIVTTGEGGIVTTRDSAVARHMQLLRSHGLTRDANEMIGATPGDWYYEQQLLGFNYRLTDLQATLGTSQLARMESMHKRRCELADRYDQLLGSLPVILPYRSADRVSSWHLYVVEIDETKARRSRAQVFASLRAAGIGVNVHYIPIHTQPYYQKLGFKGGDFPVAERYYNRAISIPLYPRLEYSQQNRVAESLRRALER